MSQNVAEKISNEIPVEKLIAALNGTEEELRAFQAETGMTREDLMRRAEEVSKSLAEGLSAISVV